MIVDAWLHVDTIPTSGGSASIGIGTEGATDIQSAAAYGGAPWSTTGPKRTTFTATTAPVKTTAERAISAVIATAALTAGKFTLFVEFEELPA